ncbi:MAG: HIT family protein, partial [Burkholderiaceae bacterium]|nr:HIT family protein [Burkholderiaceae bacterium]
MNAAGCPLCTEEGGTPVLRNELLRVVLVDDADYPGYARVIVNAHVKEMTDLDPGALARVMAAVYA